jgi:hypothetical protein
MGGQACVFYGAAQFSKDVDLLILADEDNFAGLHAALDELKAVRIAVPPFDTEALARGHAVHFRCKATGVERLRIDVMTKLRDLPDYRELWGRRTTVETGDGGEVHLLSVPDLVMAKKTQRSRDWPVIDSLVEGHYQALGHEPTPQRISFWLSESRTSERLIELAERFPVETHALENRRPLLSRAVAGDLPALREELDAEVREEQEKDRIYWEPLKRELAAFRRAERDESASIRRPS